MDIQKRAGDAAMEYLVSLSQPDGPQLHEVIARHMQSAVDALTMEHAAVIAKMSARITTLQSIGDLICRYGVACEEVATMLEKRESWKGGLQELKAFTERVVEACQRRDAIIAGMNAILKGDD